jgi:hypothetical protein
VQDCVNRTMDEPTRCTYRIDPRANRLARLKRLPHLQHGTAREPVRLPLP